METKLKIYVASSWRNLVQPGVVDALRKVGHEVYDFRNPCDGDCGFKWSQINTEWDHTTVLMMYLASSCEAVRIMLDHPLAIDGFAKDMDALESCDVVVLLLPCGASAHLEAGWAAGAGKRLVILLDSEFEPELMYKMGNVCGTIAECIEILAEGAEE